MTGRHRIQRVPPNDKKGRRQSSEVSVVAVNFDPHLPAVTDNLADVKIETTKGTGPGGQHRNKTESKVIATHLPTGISAAVDGRDQHANRRQALAVLSDRVAAHYAAHHAESINGNRRDQMTGDRAFTWTEWRDTVINHRTGRKAKMSRALKGNFDPLK